MLCSDQYVFAGLVYKCKISWEWFIFHYILGSTFIKHYSELGGTRTRNLQIRSLTRYPLRHKSTIMINLVCSSLIVFIYKSLAVDDIGKYFNRTYGLNHQHNFVENDLESLVFNYNT